MITARIQLTRVVGAAFGGLFVLGWAAGCGNSTDSTSVNPGQTGGSSSSTGGSNTIGGVGTGGNPSGGTRSTAGASASASGGASAFGGATADGRGAESSGGTSTAGGSSPAGGRASGGMASTGGVNASGGMASTGGSTATGGSNASGGSSPTGGKSASGGSGTSGQSGSGGTVSTGGSGGAVSCGTKATSDCGKSGTKCTLKVNNTDRTFYVELPSNYKPTTPYRLIFQFHPLGQTAESALTMYGLKSRISDAIFVTPQGLGSSGSTGWPNTNGQDVNFTKAMLEYVQTNFCVDRSRIFSTGFSYGGIMSLTVGCQMSDVFRAIAPEAGQLFGGSCNPTRPVAVWQSEGNSDGTVTPTSAASARDYIVKANGCSSTTHAVSPSPCVMYDGCKAGYDVTWCLFSGGHEMPSFGPDAIAAFFKQF